MKSNLTKERLREGRAVIGLAQQQIRSAEIPRLLGAAGFDYIFIDTEHGAFNLETVQDIVIAANQSGITPFVRVAELKYSLVARALDIGAHGIIFPRVEDARLLKEAISWTKFPPVGMRGFGIGPPLIDYEPAGMPEIIEHANSELMNIVQFETVKSLQLIDELLAVEGIDVAMIGPADLSISLGIPGELDHPTLVSAVEQFILDCQRNQVIPGIHCRSAEMAMFWITKGMKLVGCGGETTLLMERAQSIITEFRKPCQ